MVLWYGMLNDGFATPFADCDIVSHLPLSILQCPTLFAKENADGVTSEEHVECKF